MDNIHTHKKSLEIVYSLRQGFFFFSITHSLGLLFVYTEKKVGVGPRYPFSLSLSLFLFFFFNPQFFFFLF